jgi:2-(1,2-epoxy-1,2-dihydrophenyl)acetyl-CoA isomerase
MTHDPILTESSGGVTRITLNRPDKLNSFTRAMGSALLSALEEANASAACRVVVLTGAGRAFSAGQDLTDGGMSSGSPIDAGSLLEEIYNPLVERIASLEKPVIAAVNGVAAGAAANIALACDLVVAKRSASFLQAFARIGLIPDAGGTWVLPRLVGPARARGLALLAEPLTADKAEAWGLIWKAVDDDAFDAEISALTDKLANAATYGLALMKRALAASSTNTLRTQLDLERELQRLAGASPDCAEGIKAFVEKRPARFTGKKA